VRDGCVLTVRKRGTERFMLVGGKLEPGESARDAALRETVEEVGIDVEEATLIGEFESDAANEPGHTLHSTVFWIESDAEPVAAGEIAELRWTPLHDHPDDLAPMLEHHVLPVLRNR
jgi:8-oxo-dGTP diphosphatase